MRPVSPSRAAGALALLLLASALVACDPAARAREQGGASVLRVGWGGSPDSLNPGVGILSESYLIYGLVYDALFHLELDNTFALGLAESAERSPDGRTWTFRIRSGARFHDGAPVTAHDVRFSLELYRTHPELPFLHGYTAAFESIEAPDESTLVLRLSEPIPNLESQLVYLYVLPERHWAPWAGQPTEFANRAMIGSGSFRLVESRPNEYVRLAAHRDHPTQAPRVDEVLFVTYGSLDALVQALRTGQVDMITEMPATAVAALRRAPAIELVEGAPLAPRVADIKLNQRDPAACPPGGACTGHPALRDVRVRRAVAMATPKAELLEVVLLGMGAPGLTLLPDGLARWFHDELADHPYDLDRARALLDEAGYLDRDGDGVRETPDGGRPLRFRFHFPSESPATPRAAEIIARSWAKIGVRVDRRGVDPNALAAARAPAFDYDVILWSWESDPDPSFLLSVMTSDEISGGANDTGWSDPEYDRLFLEQAVEPDLERRRALVRRMQEIALRDVVYIVPFYPHSVQAFRRDRFRGWRTEGPGLELADRTSLAVVEPVSAPRGEP
jgi:peptide/nickel transport system substrate-binding protein